MRKLTILTTAILLVAATAPSLAASRHHSTRSHGYTNHYGYNGSGFIGSEAYAQDSMMRGGYGPYPDRPYGNPDRW